VHERVIPKKVKHIHAWLRWVISEKGIARSEFIVKDICKGVNVYLDPNDKQAKKQWYKNLHQHILSEKDSYRCPICQKYVGRIVDARHGDKCFRNSTSSISNY
jgi:hypothetical protein